MDGEPKAKGKKWKAWSAMYQTSPLPSRFQHTPLFSIFYRSTVNLVKVGCSFDNQIVCPGRMLTLAYPDVNSVLDGPEIKQGSSGRNVGAKYSV